MSDQPPERSEWEVPAEGGANAPQAPRSIAQGCFRLLVWASPTFVAAFLILSTLEYWKQDFAGPLLLLICAILIIGAFDASFSQRVRMATQDQRKAKVMLHAVKFFLWQILILAGMVVLLVGACIMMMDPI